MTRSDIEKEVKKIHDRYWDKILPININCIIANFNINIIADSNLKTKDSLGIYIPKNNNISIIKFNPYEDIAQQRLIISRLFAYHILCKKPSRHHISVDSFDNNRSIYNVFIDEFLLPKRTFQAIIEVNNIKNIDRLASIFLVTTGLVEHRARELKYL